MSRLDAELLLTLIPDAVITTDGEQRIVGWNPAAERTYGWSADEAQGRRVGELLRTELTDAQRAAMLDALRATGAWQGRVIQHHRDGRTLHILASVSAAIAPGNPTTLVAINRDISADVRRETERRLTESALRQLREVADARRGVGDRLRGLLEIGCRQLGLPTGIISRIEGERYEVIHTVDKSGALAAGQIFPLGKTVCSVTIRGDRPVHFDKLSDSELANHPCYTELALQSYIGAPLHGEGGVWGTVNFSGPEPRPSRFSRADDELVRLLALMVELELSRAAPVVAPRAGEAQSPAVQQTEALALMVSGLAHDFNNLLSGIVGAADVAIAHDRADQPVRPLLDEIRSSARAGASMGRRLLELASPSGKDEPADPDGFVSESRDLFHLLLPDSVEIDVQLGAAGARVDITAGAFEQILLNLVVNARDAMPGGGRLAVRTRIARVTTPRDLDRGYLSPGDYAVVEIEDSGAGIDEDTRARMFDLFFTNKPGNTGTGLGLATVDTLVSEAGGAIEVDSAVGRGSCFRVYLPAVIGDEPAEQPPADGPTALVVDADPLVRAIARHCLEDAGFEVFEAIDDNAALDRASVEPDLALVVVSVVRPEDNRSELTGTLSKLCPAARWVWMTAFPLDALAGARRLPKDGPVIAKPLSRDELLAAVRAAVAPAETPLSVQPTVLLVEDHRLSRLTVTELLESSGYRVIAASCGSTALAELDAHDVVVDALVTDLHLPDLDGTQLAHRVRERRNDVKVVFISGSASDRPEVRAALEHPRTTYLQKPFDVSELEQLLSALD